MGIKGLEGDDRGPAEGHLGGGKVGERGCYHVVEMGKTKEPLATSGSQDTGQTVTVETLAGSIWRLPGQPHTPGK